MQKSRCSVLLMSLVLAVAAPAQVLSPAEIKDPALRSLQEKHLRVLEKLGEELKSQKFSYPFYFSRVLDIDEKQQQQVDQRSIRFDKFGGKTVLEITGNYYASYSNELANKNQRARQTFQEVISPILKAAIPLFQSDLQVEAFAMEVSHHVRKKVLGVVVEQPENVVVVLPRAAAFQFVMAKNPAQQQGALLEGSVFVDAEPFSLWLTDDVSAEIKSANVDPGSNNSVDPAKNGPHTQRPTASGSSTPSAFGIPTHDSSQADLERMKKDNQALLDQIVREMGSRAHFVTYAPPEFISFHHATYIQFSVNSTLEKNGSRYKLAALAFDEHIGILLRPMLAYVKDDSVADGISFSTSVHMKTSLEDAPSSLAVEYFFPLPALRCYERYDCTGQQLLDAGFVLINGERVGLNLQTAEN